MVEIITAKTAGFCFGVKKAVDKAFELADPNKQVYTYGPVIHNDEVIRSLAEKGVKLIESEDELRGIEHGTVILRSHGVPKAVIDLLEERHIDYVDVTAAFENIDPEEWIRGCENYLATEHKGSDTSD